MKKYSLVIAIFVITVSLFATNGMNMIGYGARSSAMGGISLGLLDDINSLNNNPAAISFIDYKGLELSTGLLIPAVNFKNDLNDIDGESKIFPLPSLGYVHGTPCKVTFGMGFYTQGGMGATYEGVKHNIFKNYDMDPTTQDDAYITDLEYHSSIAYMKLMPTVAYQVTPKLSLGLAPSLGYAMLEMKMPYTLAPSDMKGVANPVTGMTFGDMFGAPNSAGGLGYDEITAYADMGEDAATALGFGGKFGAAYKVNSALSFGFAYTAQSTITFEGEASMDMTAQFGDAYERMVGGALQQGAPDVTTAQGMVNAQLVGMGIDMQKGMIADYDSEIEMAWPQEIGVGFEYQICEKISFGADVKWINWAEAMDEFKMTFTEGTNDNINTMMGSEDLHLTMPLDWDDQVVIALGTEYKVLPQLALRAGYNYASNPVPAETILPIFPAVVENHITLGFGYCFTKNLKIDMAYELNLEKEIEVDESIIANEYDNSTSSLAENVIHFTLGYKF